jgi:hypothetical protein
VGLAALTLFFTTLSFTTRIEKMEIIAAKYRAADAYLRLGSLQREEEEASNSRLLLGPATATVADLRQPQKEASSLTWLIGTASILKGDFQVEVLDVLQDSLGSSAEGMPCPKANLKSSRRAHEKAVLEYGRDNTLLKDMLRGSIICGDLEGIRTVWGALRNLEEDGSVKILQVKNRFRGEAMATGYRDINTNINFKGLICEVQLHCTAHYELKSEQHQVYALCRSYGLLGDVGKSSQSFARNRNSRVSPSMKKTIFATRFAFASLLGSWGWSYAVLGLDNDIWNVFFAFDGDLLILWKTLSLCIACWVLYGLLLVDVWKTSRAAGATVIVFTISGLPFLAMRSQRSIPITICAIIFPLLHFCVVRFLRNTVEGDVSRVGLLFLKYFGVDGVYFAWKVGAMQYLAVGLQAYSKLLPIGDVAHDAFSVGFYWFFLFVLTLNACVPPFLLSSSNPWMRREGALLFDVLCDVFYLVAFVMFMFFHQFMISAVNPIGIISFSSNASPALRILSVCKILENGTNDRSASATPSRLPRKAAVIFGALSLSTLLAIVLSGQTGYPFNTQACRPCSCSKDGVLQHCPLDVSRLHLARRGIKRIATGAFRKLDNLEYLNLPFNSITTLENGTFVDLPKLRILSFWSNFVEPSSLHSTIAWTFSSDFSGITSIEAGAFVNASALQVLELSFNGLSSVSSLGNVFNELPALQLFRIAGNPLSCEDVAAQHKYKGECR